MRINISGEEHDKDWLLGSTGGQSLLEKAKSSGVRPRCTCVSSRPEMYIATRGNLHYLARMPNTADQHSEDCLSHLVPSKLYSLDTPLKIMEALLKNSPPVGGKWNDLRAEVMRAAETMTVDGEILAPRLLVPTFFNKDRSDEQRAKYEEFFAEGIGEDVTHRRWLLACIKEATPSKYGARLTMKHMPRIVFWAVKELAPKLLQAAAGTEVPLCLFEVKKTSTGVLITDCAVRFAGERTGAVPAMAPPVKTVESEEGKLAEVRTFLDLPQSAPIGDLFTAMLEYCLARAREK